MRVWYSDVYTYQLKNLVAKKLGDCGHLAKFLGYPEESAGYKVYDPATHQITIVQKPLLGKKPEHCTISPSSCKTMIQMMSR